MPIEIRVPALSAIMMSATGSFDHHAIDGADGGQTHTGVQGAGGAAAGAGGMNQKGDRY